MCQFILAMVVAAYVGFSRLYHLRFVTREPMGTGILKVLRLPPHCTLWRFLASLHGLFHDYRVNRPSPQPKVAPAR
jgi:hypothetical protein